MTPVWFVVFIGILLSVFFLFVVLEMVQIYKMDKHTRNAITAVEATSEPTKCFAWFPKPMTNGGTLWLEWGYKMWDGSIFWFRENPDMEKEQ